MGKTAIIVGAGPAGLCAAYELLSHTDIKPIILESSEFLGGISRTIEYHNNRIDIGGHRFFSKSDRVMDWWSKIIPFQDTVNGTGAKREIPDPEKTDQVMLLCSRKSRIFWRRRLFDYPLRMSLDTIRKMGLVRMTRAGLSYLQAMIWPNKPEKNLRDFMINRFGQELYATFFKSYTEKVWGVACEEIPADWGAQRIKGFSIQKALAHALFPAKKSDTRQKEIETTLIDRFLYPKFGPGQMWEEVAQRIHEMGGEIHMQCRATRFNVKEGAITSVTAKDLQSGEILDLQSDYVFSSMPIKDLVPALATEVPQDVRAISAGLKYRDFFTVGLLVNKIKQTDPHTGEPLKDNWIYIQEQDVLIGRLQIFNNWSRYLVSDPTKVWLGLEYFCNKTDPIWSKPDSELIQLGLKELSLIDIVDPKDFVDGCVIRMENAYPAYFGTYDRFAELKQYLEGFSNLFCIGRNGQHRYNNQDHSMLTAMVAVDCIAQGKMDQKAKIWEINAEKEYHEAKSEE